MPSALAMSAAYLLEASALKNNVHERARLKTLEIEHLFGELSTPMICIYSILLSLTILALVKLSSHCSVGGCDFNLLRRHHFKHGGWETGIQMQRYLTSMCTAFRISFERELLLREAFFWFPSARPFVSRGAKIAFFWTGDFLNGRFF